MKMFENHVKTFVLLALMSGLVLWVGNLVGGYQGLTFALIFVIGMNLFSYFFSHKMVLMMYRAKEVTESSQPKLHSIVREVAHLAKIPMPKVYMIPSLTPNAFATGRNPNNAVVACTQGILELLSDSELKGVIAHEIAHIKNRDILIQTVAATMAGIISYVAMMARWAAIFGGFGGRDNRNSSSGIEFLVLALLTPLIATLLQLAISRSREYLADERGAKTVHAPLALASALEKIENSVRMNPIRFGSPSTSSLFIINPFKSGFLVSILSTHPPVSIRVKKLRSMKV